MQNPKNRPLPEPNPVTAYAHTRQVWLQILLPLIVFCLAILVLAVSVSLTGNDQVTRFSDISLIFLILPTVIVGVVILSLFGLGIFLMARFLKIIPAYTNLVQIYIDRFSKMVTKLSDRSASPIFFVESTAASLKAVFRRHES
jgi:hypothetical protein